MISRLWPLDKSAIGQGIRKHGRPTFRWFRNNNCRQSHKSQNCGSILWPNTFAQTWTTLHKPNRNIAGYTYHACFNEDSDKINTRMHHPRNSSFMQPLNAPNKQKRPVNHQSYHYQQHHIQTASATSMPSTPPATGVWIAQYQLHIPGPGFNSWSRSPGIYKLMFFWAGPHP